MRAFLAAYRLTASITRAAEAAGISREAHYRLLERSAEYRAAFAAATAIAGDRLEDEAVRRAVEGVERPVLYHGKPVLIPVDPKKLRGKKKPLLEHDYSDALLIALLKAKKPKEYKDRVEHGLDPDVEKKFSGSMQELLDLYRTMTTGQK